MPLSALDRRTFLKELSAVAAACTALPLSAVATESQQGNTVWKRAPCRLCGVGCGLLVGIQNGKAVAVKGDPDSPVSQGLACVKGYHSVHSMYGQDRLTRARIRRDGALVQVPMREALDLVAQKLRETTERHGKDSIAMYGSGEWTLSDGYVAAKLFERGLGTSNIATDADLSMASAREGLESSFGLTGPIGCYEDIDHADVFVIWNQNLAETDPVLFSRMLERRRSSPGVKIIELATRTTRTSYAADRSLLYIPQSDLAIANALCQEIVHRRWHNRDFVDRHIAFKRGPTGIGDGLSSERVLPSEDATAADWSDYIKFLEAYTPERVQQISSLPADDIRWLASLYGDRSRKVMSMWGAGANQHTRGTWLNNLIYNIHLLVGKVAEPGNSPFCLASQPVGLSGSSIESTQPGRTATALSIFRALERGTVRFLWIQGANPLVDLPNLQRYRRAATANDRFLVVSDSYPTPTTDAADVVLPAALWIEREGISGNAERRLQHFDRLLTPPGEAMSYSAQLIEVARRLGVGALFPWERAAAEGGIWEELRASHTKTQQRLPSLAELRAGHGVMWPLVDGHETKRRYNPDHDPAADRARGDFDFYGHPDHRAWIWLRPYEPPAESPNRAYPFWLSTVQVLEHSGTGSLTRRIPILQRSVPRTYVEINRQDAERLGIQNGETVRLVSRRGSLLIEARIDYRAQPPRGHVFVPSFDDQRPVNTLTLDASCPLSGQSDPKCAVRVERLARGGS